MVIESWVLMSAHPWVGIVLASVLYRLYPVARGEPWVGRVVDPETVGYSFWLGERAGPGA